jgi:hypothetical protein
MLCTRRRRSVIERYIKKIAEINVLKLKMNFEKFMDHEFPKIVGH